MVEVGDHYGGRAWAGGAVDGWKKSAIAPPEQDGDGTVAVVGNSQIRSSIAVKIRGGQASGGVAHQELPRAYGGCAGHRRM